MDNDLFEKYYYLFFENINDLIFENSSRKAVGELNFLYFFSGTPLWYGKGVREFLNGCYQRNNFENLLSLDQKAKMDVLHYYFLNNVLKEKPPFEIYLVNEIFLKIKYNDLEIFNGFLQSIDNGQLNDFDFLQEQLSLDNSFFFENKIKKEDYYRDLRSFMQHIYYKRTIYTFIIK